MDSNYLQHHGRMGMKWGKRNGPPYPLTGSGNKAFLKQKNQESNKDHKSEKPGDIKKTTSKPKTEKEMTDDELKAAVLRLANEKKYREYMRDEELRNTSKGKKYATSFLEKTGEHIVSKASEKTAAYIVNKIFGRLDDSNRRTGASSKKIEVPNKKTETSSKKPKSQKRAYETPSMHTTYLLPDFKNQKK